jgi:ribosome-associated protein
VAKIGEHALRVEGSPQSGWILIDYGAVIVHIFSRAERDYYRLERLWATATPVLRLE